MSFASGFLKSMSKNAVGMTLRETSNELQRRLESDIIYPEFYHEYGEFEGLEFTMGQFFMDNAHYDRKDQIMCSIDGTVNYALVPHVYRQEMMPGTSTTYHHEIKGHQMQVHLDINESPINLFKPDFEAFPSVKHVNHFYWGKLAAGDCLYIPAFYFY